MDAHFGNTVSNWIHCNLAFLKCQHRFLNRWFGAFRVALTTVQQQFKIPVMNQKPCFLSKTHE